MSRTYPGHRNSTGFLAVSLFSKEVLQFVNFVEVRPFCEHPFRYTGDASRMEGDTFRYIVILIESSS